MSKAIDNHNLKRPAREACPEVRMRGLQTERTAQVVIAGHAFMQNLRRGHHELGSDAEEGMRIPAAFTELARAI